MGTASPEATLLFQNTNTSMRTEDEMPRRGIGLFGFVVATLLCAAGTSEIAQAATIGLTGGSSRAAPGKPMLFDFDWVLHPSVGIDQGDFSFSADFGNESPFQSIGPAGGECV